jgi:hypothetical protein
MAMVKVVGAEAHQLQIAEEEPAQSKVPNYLFAFCAMFALFCSKQLSAVNPDLHMYMAVRQSGKTNGPSDVCMALCI